MASSHTSIKRFPPMDEERRPLFLTFVQRNSEVYFNPSFLTFTSYSLIGFAIGKWVEMRDKKKPSILAGRTERRFEEVGHLSYDCLVVHHKSVKSHPPLRG
jgi:hypothetical protein